MSYVLEESNEGIVWWSSYPRCDYKTRAGAHTAARARHRKHARWIRVRYFGGRVVDLLLAPDPLVAAAQAKLEST